MNKYLGLTWIEWVCIVVAVIVADITQDAFRPETILMRIVTYAIGWSVGFTICYLLISQILKWTGKN
jgi:hypothetical protein